jgi:DNA-directed RNA polymerase subunit RPC12/RpoP
MKYTVINLAGILNKTLSENLLGQVDLILREPGCILLDFIKVTELEENAFPAFKSVLEKVSSMGLDRIAFSSISPEFQMRLAELVSFEIPAFPDKFSAKSFLEETHSQSRKFETISTLENQYPKITQFVLKGDIYYINCLSCGTKLRIRSIGNHACPSCKSKFFFQPATIDLPKKETVTTAPLPVSNVAPATQYEMLSLD